MSKAFAGVVAALLMGSAGMAAAEDEMRAHLLTLSCSGCHGDAPADAPLLPGLHGRDPGELYEMLMQFKQGAAGATVMNRIAAGYSEPELKLLAEYLGRQ